MTSIRQAEGEGVFGKGAAERPNEAHMPLSQPYFWK